MAFRLPRVPGPRRAGPIAPKRSVTAEPAGHAARRQDALRGAVRRPLEALEGRTLLSITPPLPDAPVMGINVDAIHDFSTAWVFNDTFKASRPWLSHAYNTVTGAENFNDSTPVAVDANGWPTQLATWTNDQGQVIRQRISTLMFREIGDKYPAGTYRAEWEGTGSVSFAFAAQAVQTGTTPQGKRFAVLNVTPNNSGIWLKINDLDPADPVRNMRVWMPDYDTDGNGTPDASFAGKDWRPGDSFSPFHPEFVNRLKPFGSLRFMEWGDTNGSTLLTWDQRRRVDEARQTGDGRGVAIEYMVELANEVDADPWFNMPFAADDDYIRNYATLVLNSLEPDKKVYVEWSNEIWNFASGFKAFHWITDQLARPENASYGGESGRWKFAADQTKRDFDIWTDVFTAAGQQDRLVRVVAGQTANSFVLEQLLLNMEGKFDAVSSAAYFGFNSTQTAGFNASTTPEDIARAVLDNVPVSLSRMQKHKDLADQYSRSLGRPIEYVNYEWGQGTTADGRNVNWLQALYDAQTHPLMYEAYDDMMRGARDMGVGLMEHFTYVNKYSKFGTWGALQYQNEPISQAPKYQALLDGVSGFMYRPEFRIETVDRFLNEFGQSSANFRVSRGGDTSTAVDVTFTAGGTAGAADIQPLPSTISFAAGEVSKLVTVTAVDDALREGAETLTLTLTNGTGYKVDYRTSSASVTVHDDEGSVVWGVPIQNASFETGDFTGWALKPTGTTNKNAVVPIVDAGVRPPGPKDGRYFVWGAGRPNNIGGGATPAGVAQRFDLSGHAERIDWGFANLNFTGWGSGEGVGTDHAYLEVAFYDAPTGGSQIGTAVVSNKAEAPNVWTAMALNALVPVGARGVELRAFAWRPPQFNTTSAGFDDLSARLTYSLLPTVGVSAGPAAAEGGANSSFTFTRGGPPVAGPLTVQYTVAGTATAGADYQPLTGTVTIPAGQTSVTVPLSVVNDLIVELPETVQVTVVAGAAYDAAPAAAGGTATVTVNDNDKPAVTVAAIDAAASELGRDPAIFTFTRASDLLSVPLVVRYTVNGTASASDYGTLSRTVTIPVGERSATVTVTPTDDLMQEVPETVVLTVAADGAYVVGSPSNASATIADDDLPVVTIEETDGSAAEAGQDPAVLTVRRTSDVINYPLTVRLFVNGTATEGADYAQVSHAVTIPAGQTTATFTVTPNDDALQEPTEAVVVTVVAGQGYTLGQQLTASALILDNDGAPAVAEVRVGGSAWTAAFLNELRRSGLGAVAGGFSVTAAGQLKTLPWTNVNTVSLRFTENVLVQQGDLAVRGVRVPAYAVSGFAYDPATFTATWTLAAPVAPGDKLLLDLDGTTAGAVTDSAGLPLDGEWANGGAGPGQFPSGNGAAGGNFRFRFNVLPGDANRDGVVNTSDFFLVRNSIGKSTANPGPASSAGTYSVFYDLNGDAVINTSDLLLARSEIGRSLPAGEPAAAAPSPSMFSARRVTTRLWSAVEAEAGRA